MYLNIYRFRKPLVVVYNPEVLINRCKSIVDDVKSSENPVQEKKFSHTVILPKTSFPLRVNVTKRFERDAYIYETCKFGQLYEWQRDHKSGPEFILHDGPPYANGRLHMGHAINKILKDITIRQKILQDFKVHYVPGWDCHGLPIELKAITPKDGKTVERDAVEIRCKARKYASEAIREQMEVFKSWGITANWKESYFTYSNEYMKNQFHQFLTLFDQGFVYRDLKPIFWSPSSRTALAEAELEYNHQHVSREVILRLNISQLPDVLISTIPANCKVQAIVWTTTPWTLPANQAICFNPDMSYCLVKNDSEAEVSILAVDCVNAIQKKLGKELRVLQIFSGDVLKTVQYSHPFDKERLLPFLPGLHVTSEMGTGLVHTAPAHGFDDFLVSLQHQIPLVNIVDENGCFTEDVGSDLQGLFVLNEGNLQVLQKLKSLILHSDNYIHSYPYDWRTKKPVFIKACQQWFIDTDALKTKALELLAEVKVYPTKHQTQSTLISQLQKRPYWCISRQRVWGVPIPVLYSRIDEKPVISRALIDHYSKLLDNHGPDFWWKLTEKEIAPSHLLEVCGLSSSDIEKGKDILDIWFDSGLSWSYVLGNEKQADLYLEGVDQYTGWFQSSLMTSTALCGKSPYKSLFVHGFAVDKNGLKMSKSLGNVVDPLQITRGAADIKKYPAYGNDTLRWWVASHASQNVNVPVSKSIMEASANEVQKIRIVSRFLLGVLWDYSQSVDSHSMDNFFSLDLWMLSKLKNFEDEVFESYNSYQYKRVCKIITNFVTNEVSSLYCHLTKDRLYCRKQNDVHRLSCQFVLQNILETISRAAAPILPFMMEEVYLHQSCKDGENLFYSKVKKIPENWHFPVDKSRVETALKAKEIINKMYHSNTMKLFVQVQASGSEFVHLKELERRNELNEILQVSHSEVVDNTGEIQVKLEPAHGKMCGRCRQYTSEFEDKVCHRCEEVLKEISI